MKLMKRKSLTGMNEDVIISIQRCVRRGAKTVRLRKKEVRLIWSQKSNRLRFNTSE